MRISDTTNTHETTDLLNRPGFAGDSIS